MKGQRALVTGGAGFIGSHLAHRLLRNGYRVTVVDDLSSGHKDNVPSGVDLIEADLSKTEQFDRWQKTPCDVVMHLAGQSSGELSFRNPRHDLESHVFSTFNVLEWCRTRGVRRFLYASSMAVYGDPVKFPVREDGALSPKTFYAAAKISAEAYTNLFHSLGVNTTIFRLFSVYGPGQDLTNKAQGMASIYLSYALEGVPILVKGRLDRFRDLTYIDDVVDAWIGAIERTNTHGKTYNLSSGRRTTVASLVDAIRQAVGCSEHPVICQEGTLGDQFGMEGDSTAITKDIGWRVRIPLEEGLKQMVAFERARKEVR